MPKPETTNTTEAEGLTEGGASCKGGSPTQSQTTPVAPNLSDEAFQFIKEHSDIKTSEEFAVFEGDWGNWNWLWSEIYKRCVK